MISLAEVKHLHIELSSKCNARCPLCSRNFYGFDYNRGYEETNLTLVQIQKLLPIEFVNQLDEILFNGTYGDFVMNPESVEIIQWLRQTNPLLVMHISTNGGARDRSFWQALAKLDVEISFCIDGLEDTHHIYRQDTTYNKVISNARTFIKAGGRAVWTMTEFDHNRHQIDEAQRRATALNFVSFNKRPTNRDTGPVYNNKGQKIYLMKTTGAKFPNQITSEWITNYSDGGRYTKGIVKKQALPLQCDVLNKKSLYISASGEVDPCCFVGLVKQGNRGNADLQLLRQHPQLTLEDGIDFTNKVLGTFDSQQLLVCQQSCAS